MSQPPHKIEQTALLLSYAGVLPLCGAAFLLWIPHSLFSGAASPQIHSLAVVLQNWVQYYCAIILSFLGAVHWGAVISSHAHTFPTDPQDRFPRIAHLRYAIMPALFGWMALIPNNVIEGLIISYVVRYCLLGVGFVLALHVDLKSVRSGLFPDWYGALRKSVTFWVIIFITLIILKLTFEGHW